MTVFQALHMAFLVALIIEVWREGTRTQKRTDRLRRDNEQARMAENFPIDQLSGGS